MSRGHIAEWLAKRIDNQAGIALELTKVGEHFPGYNICWLVVDADRQIVVQLFNPKGEGESYNVRVDEGGIVADEIVEALWKAIAG